MQQFGILYALGFALFGQGVPEVPIEGVQFRQRRRGDLRAQKGKDQREKTTQRLGHGFGSERSGNASLEHARGCRLNRGLHARQGMVRPAGSRGSVTSVHASRWIAGSVPQ